MRYTKVGVGVALSQHHISESAPTRGTELGGAESAPETPRWVCGWR